MAEYSRSIETSEFVNQKNELQATNPLYQKNERDGVAMGEYTQVQSRIGYDEDVLEILNVSKMLNNLVPIRMPIYNFNINEINGDAYYRPDGTLLLIREYDSDVIRDYYAVTLPDDDEFSVSRILEHDKRTGRLKVRIEPITRKGSRLTTNITIFDMKINNKYTLIQLSEGGFVNNISEFTGKGKSFKTLFRNINNFKPARYLEGRETQNNGFEMIDCLFGVDGNIARIKRYSNKKEICVDYTEDKKSIRVKNN